jgi:hypothetical protein
MFRIRRFGIVKTANIVAVMYVVVIAIFVIPVALFVVLFGRGQAGIGAVGVLGFGLFAAVIYGALGWVFTALACALYNVVAGWVGGIEVQVEPVAPPPPVPLWGPVIAPPPPATPPPASPPAGEGPPA